MPNDAGRDQCVRGVMHALDAIELTLLSAPPPGALKHIAVLAAQLQALISTKCFESNAPPRFCEVLSQLSNAIEVGGVIDALLAIAELRKMIDGATPNEPRAAA